MMTNPNEKSALKAYGRCRLLFYVTVAFCLLWCLWFSCQTYNQLLTPGMIEFKEGSRVLQVILFLVYWAIPFVYLLLSTGFFRHLLLGLRSGIIFNKRCVGYLYGLGVLYFFSDILISNIYNWGVMADFQSIILTPSFVAVPVIIFVFATLFKLACKVSEDSALTI